MTASLCKKERLKARQTAFPCAYEQQLAFFPDLAVAGSHMVHGAVTKLRSWKLVKVFTTFI